MIQKETQELKNLSRYCAGRVPVLLQRSLYRAIKLTFATDVGGIITEGRITSDVGTGSLDKNL